jgi:AraC-like DNA-binding protein
MKIVTSPYLKTLYVWNSVSATFFYGGVTPFHSHNTMQLVFDMRKTFKCRVQNTEWGVYKSVIIKENAIHQLDTNDSVQLLLYLDAESEIAKAIRLNYLSGIDICSLNLEVLDYARPGELERCLIEPNAQLLEQLVHRLLNQLIDNQKTDLSDERIKKVINLLASDSSEKMTISHLAKKVFLSESRLRFRFKKATGVPLHRYIIWNKIMLAIGKIMNGSTVQDAAFDCGFTDSSHFHKLLLRMFGVSPSQFIKHNSKKSLQILTRYPLSIESRVFNDESGNANKVYKI